MVKIDTCADVHVFNDRSLFTEGVNPSNIVLTTINNADRIPANGEGPAAMVIADVGGTCSDVVFTDCILRDDSPVNILSGQILKSKGVCINLDDGYIQFGDDARTKFPLHNYNQLFVQVPNTYLKQTLVTAQFQSPVPDIIVRGKSAGGQQNLLNTNDTAALYQAITGLGAKELRMLPSVTNAPEKLANISDKPRTDHEALNANAPKLPAPSKPQRKAALVIATDLAGPYPRSKHGGYTAAVNFLIDNGDPEDEWEWITDFCTAKSDYPDRLAELLGRRDFTGYTLYCDNEIVLNSGKVKGVAKRGGIVEIRNSCEYVISTSPGKMARSNAVGGCSTRAPASTPCVDGPKTNTTKRRSIGRPNSLTQPSCATSPTSARTVRHHTCAALDCPASLPTSRYCFASRTYARPRPFAPPNSDLKQKSA